MDAQIILSNVTDESFKDIPAMELASILENLAMRLRPAPWFNEGDSLALLDKTSNPIGNFYWDALPR